MKTLYLKSIESTQEYLKKLISDSELTPPLAVVADIQTSGVGSRDNTWEGLEGNLFLSFAISLDELPTDLRLESASIYFSHILKDILEDLGSDIWLKWPNDFYLYDKKVGGLITNVLGDTIICGLGLNLVNAPNGCETLDIEVDRDGLIKIYTEKIKKNISWKQIFSKYKINFYLNQNFYTHNKSLRVSLENAKLQDDGSVIVNGERIYSLR